LGTDVGDGAACVPECRIERPVVVVADQSRLARTVAALPFDAPGGDDLSVTLDDNVARDSAAPEPRVVRGKVRRDLAVPVEGRIERPVGVEAGEREAVVPFLFAPFVQIRGSGDHDLPVGLKGHCRRIVAAVGAEAGSDLGISTAEGRVERPAGPVAHHDEPVVGGSGHDDLSVGLHHHVRCVVTS
jgi:hypothetical protein